MEVSTPIKDAVSFKLFEKDLMEKRIGDGVRTTERKISCTDDLKWWIEYFPAGSYQEYQSHVSVYIHVSKHVSAKATIKVDGSSIERTELGGCSFRFIDFQKFASHENLLPLFKNGQLTITCDVEFPRYKLVTDLRPHIFRSFDDGSADFELVIGSNHVKVHKNFLALLSPVFNAMFSHDTTEVRTGKDVITDFDFETVKAAIDFCYGKGLYNFSSSTIVEVLRFADKYDIKAITVPLEELLLSNLSVETFSIIMRYAYDCSRKTVLAKCVEFFKDNEDIQAAIGFMDLTSPAVSHLLQ